MAKIPVFGRTMILRIPKSNWFPKAGVILANPQPWVLQGWRALRPRQKVVVAALLKTIADYNAKGGKAGTGMNTREYVKTYWYTFFNELASRVNYNALPKAVRARMDPNALNRKADEIIASITGAPVAVA